MKNKLIFMIIFLFLMLPCCESVFAVESPSSNIQNIEQLSNLNISDLNFGNVVENANMCNNAYGNLIGDDPYTKTIKLNSSFGAVTLAPVTYNKRDLELYQVIDCKGGYYAWFFKAIKTGYTEVEGNVFTSGDRQITDVWHVTIID